MKLRDIGEFGFIDRIKSGCLMRDRNIIKGIGDDCAVFRPSSGMVTLLTTDMLVEEIHFQRGPIPPFKLGRKSLAVNISDIAAMGGVPREAVVSIAIPESLPVEYLDELYDGMKSMAGEFDVNLLGGDTTASPRHLVINIALTGEMPENEVLFRSGAKAGDCIFLTGTVGSSAAGLDILLNNRPPDNWQPLVDSHIDPQPHIHAGRVIAGARIATSLIDVSDGLASDLGHICVESHAGAIIDYDKIPLTDLFKTYVRHFGLDCERMALHVGEDYVLLGTVPEIESNSLENALKSQNCDFFRIGQIVERKGIALRNADGLLRNISARGYDHFRKESE